MQKSTLLSLRVRKSPRAKEDPQQNAKIAKVSSGELVVDPHSSYDDILETVREYIKNTIQITNVTIDSHKALTRRIAAQNVNQKPIIFEGLLILCRKKKTIEKLTLRGMALWSVVKFLPSILLGLQNSNVSSLDLSKNGFGKLLSNLDYLKAIAFLAAQSTSPLKKLDLSENELTNKYAITILEQLQNINKPLLIDLRKNSLTRNIEDIIEHEEPDLFETVKTVLVSSPAIILLDCQMQDQAYHDFLAGIAKFRTAPSEDSFESELLPLISNCVLEKRGRILTLLDQLLISFPGKKEVLKPLHRSLANAIELGDIISSLDPIYTALSKVKALPAKIILQEIRDVKNFGEISQKTVELFLSKPSIANTMTKTELPPNSVQIESATWTEMPTRERANATLTSPSPS